MHVRMLVWHLYAYGVWNTVYGVWCMAYGVLAYGVWRMAHGVWRMAYGAWRMAYGAWHMAYGVWRMCIRNAYAHESNAYAYGVSVRVMRMPTACGMCTHVCICARVVHDAWQLLIDHIFQHHVILCRGGMAQSLSPSFSSPVLVLSCAVLNEHFTDQSHDHEGSMMSLDKTANYYVLSIMNI